MVRGISNNMETSLPVSALMSAPLLGIPLTTSKVDAYHTMVKHGVRHLRVVDADGHPAGLVSETDFRQHGGIEHFLQLRDVGSAMSTNIAMLSVQSSVADAARMMAQRKVDYVLVGADNHAEGIVTERDIVRLFRQHDHERSLDKVMTKSVSTIRHDTHLQDAARRMNEERIRRLVVEDQIGG
jgi:CBS domain-containing protein